jgi:septum formation protein
MAPSHRYILASRSPRRRELLGLLVPPESIEVLPPPSSQEADFAELNDLVAIRLRLQEIASTKADEIVGQLGEHLDKCVVIAADTTIIATDPETGQHQVLEQPPETDDWQATVRDWFCRYYAGRWHIAATALELRIGQNAPVRRVVETRVEFRPDVDRWLDWYLQTGESRGKAGGYAIQGAGSVFVSRVEGSLSNVVGLPLEVLAECLKLVSVE